MSKNDSRMAPSAEDVGSTGVERPDRPRPGLFRTALDVALASIGIAGVLSDEARALYRRSIERGRENARRVEEQLKLTHLSEGRTARRARRRAQHSQLAYEDWRAALASSPGAWLNLPTAADIHELNRQIAELEAKINQIANE